MGYVVDRWHRSQPRPDEPECGEHKGKVASGAHGKGKRWQARYDGPDGKERTSVWRTQVEAEREIIKQEHAKLTGSWLDPQAGKINVARFALETWLPAQDIVGRTEIEYLGVLRRYLIPEWGAREMQSIRPSEAGAWQRLLTSKYELTGTYPNKVARHVRSVFRLAVIDRVIAVSPFEGIKAPKAVETRVTPPDIAEVVRLVEHAYHDRWRAMLEFTALTGLRSGEIRGLDVRKVDFLRKQARIERQLVYEAGKGHYFADLKTGAGKRMLPLNDRAVDLLAAYVKKFPPPLTGEWAGCVFLMPDAKPIGESTLDWALKSICRKARVQSRHWHELRHHYASVLIAGGEQPNVVQARLGHKSVMVTLRIYVHLWAESTERTRSVLDEAWMAAESSGLGGRLAEPGSGGVALTMVRA